MKNINKKSNIIFGIKVIAICLTLALFVIFVGSKNTNSWYDVICYFFMLLLIWVVFVILIKYKEIEIKENNELKNPNNKNHKI